MATAQVPRVHCLHRGAYMQCTTWAVLGPAGAIVVDPGSGVAEETILQRLGDLGCPPTALTYVLITHCHCDHALGAGALRRLGARVVASERTAELLRTASPVIWGEHPDLVRAAPVDVTVCDGDVIDAAGLRVACVRTPGHTRGSTTYVTGAEEGRVGFSGDLLFHSGHPGWAGVGEYDPAATLASLSKLRMLKLARVYPGHGVAIGDVDGWLRRGLAEGEAGRWHPTTEWQAVEVPSCLRRGEQIKR